MVSDEKVCMAFDYGEEIKGICETILRMLSDCTDDDSITTEIEYLESRLNLMEKKHEKEIKKAREEEKKKYEPFRRFLRTLEVWAKTEIKIGKDYDIEKGQTASYGKGYDNALENVIEKIVKFQKERFKKLKSGREAEANTTGGREDE